MSYNEIWLQIHWHLVITICVFGYTASKCIFDDIQPHMVPKKHLDYDTHLGKFNTVTAEALSVSEQLRTKRAVDSLYKPIRIHVHYLRIDEELILLGEQERLKSLVSLAVQKVTSILSVVSVKERLLLGRNPLSCRSVHDIGPNKDKCARVNPAYAKETCVNDVTIPDEHMEGLYKWNSTYPYPVHVEVPEGDGLENTDYVLYVQSLTTKTCTTPGLNVVAYAAYCHLDQKYRPISGYMNLCPSQIKETKTYDKHKSLLIVLHELFHALGFSKDLYYKLQECTITGGSLSCSPHPKPVRTVFGVQRLVTPKLVNLTSEHYGCRSGVTINEFGPVLETRHDSVTSHWDAAFLQGSIMAPGIGQPHLTVLDKFTLGFFEDTGWYKVNYNFAENYSWGKGGQCHFGLSETCRQNSTQFFCTGNAQGCHYLHSDKGNCSTDGFLHGCMMFQPTKQDNCQTHANSPDDASLEMYGESYQTDSRCFVSSLVKGNDMNVTQTVGRCYQHRCVHGTLQVQIGTADWLTCPSQKKIKVPRFSGFLQCPPDGILCHSTPSVTATPALHTTQTTYASTTIPTFPDKVCLEVIFPEASYYDLDSSGLLIAFRDAVIDKIIRQAGITLQRMRNIKLHKGSVIFSFDLLPPSSFSDGPASGQVFHTIKKLVGSRSFSVRLEGTVYVASVIRQAAIPNLTPPTIHPGVVAAIVLCVLLAIGVAVGLVYLGLKKQTSSQVTKVQPRTKLQMHKQPMHKADLIQVEKKKEKSTDCIHKFLRSSYPNNEGSGAISGLRRTSVAGSASLSGVQLTDHSLSSPVPAEVQVERPPSSPNNAQIHITDTMHF